MNLTEDQYLAHYGILRRSGRYPWGSGGNQATRNKSFLDYIEDMLKQGLSESEIAKGVGLSTTQLRAAKSIARNQQRQANIAMAQRLKDKGYSNGAIAQRMGLAGESSVRALLAPGAKDKADILSSTSDMLKREVSTKKFVDVGAGVETHLQISKERLNTAVAMLKEEGYVVHPLKIATGPNKYTEMKILAAPGTKWSDVQKNMDQIQQINAVTPFSDDGGRTFSSGRIHPPISVDPSRVEVRYAEQGGTNADGVIYVRPGVDDISLGQSRYAQVRIKVGDSHYLKGMAMYKDDLPKGTDLLFNTNKSDTGNKLDAMKKLTDDPDYPFGSVVRQLLDKPGTPQERVISAMNIVGSKDTTGAEGGWKTWSRSISSQVLSKQSPSLAKKQLDMTFERRQKEFNDINALTNPTVKRKLLETFAETTDAAAVDLKAAALNTRQGWHVILPIESMSSKEVYAPNFRNGEQVVLIRYPHAGTFEIPQLTVNNNHPEAKKLLGDAADAVGINAEVAQHLSGADFDGDTVLVVPNNNGKIKTSPALESLKNFDPKSAYPKYDGMEVISSRRKQQEMGNVSNLITDMTIKGASHNEIARAVKHSMVVIDSEKHELNYKLSAEVNGIKALKEKYQGGGNRGASTLISLATSETYVDDRTLRPYSEGGPVDKATGKKVYVPTGATRKLPSGEVVPKRIKSVKLAETDDAHTLVSTADTPIENLYADHSNKLKDLANQARLSAIKTPRLEYSPSAKRIYAPQVASLDSKLTVALQNAPLERKARIIAKTVVDAKKAANPGLDGDSLKKIKNQELEIARARVGAKKQQIKVTPEEWNAIQAGAISDSKLGKILQNTDLDSLKAMATPRTNLKMTAARTSLAVELLQKGYTRAQVADRLGVSLVTLDNSLEA